MNYIYLDNASTSFPKPNSMLQGMENYLKNIGANPYRGLHPLAHAANRTVSHLRCLLGGLLGIKTTNHICFTYNATYGINILLKGFLKPNDHVIISSFEHNSVLRPLHYLKKTKNIHYDVWKCNCDGNFNLTDLENLIRPNTRLLFMSTHSNVIGMPLPIREISAIARKNKVSFGVDCTQAAGCVLLNLGDLVDMAVGTGHKSLLGPPGIGFLYVRNPDEVEALIHGSGGYISSELDHPEIAPAKYEAGTINALAVAGLSQSIEWLKNHSEEHKKLIKKLFTSLKEGLNKLKTIKTFGYLEHDSQLPVLAFNVQGVLPTQVEYYLASNKIIVRSGLQCAPLIHQALGTYPHGAVRVSLSPLNCMDHIHALIHHLDIITKRKNA